MYAIYILIFDHLNLLPNVGRTHTSCVLTNLELDKQKNYKTMFKHRYEAYTLTCAKHKIIF